MWFIEHGYYKLPLRVIGSKIKSRSLLQRYPTDPALGLNYIHEWNDPRGHGVKWYTCTLQGCKSAWGKSFEMCAHLIGNKNKHSRNYLGSLGVSDTNMLTLDKLLVSIDFLLGNFCI